MSIFVQHSLLLVVGVASNIVTVLVLRRLHLNGRDEKKDK